jgi:antitoxin HicB
MRKKSNPHTGSSFSDFLENEGLEAEVSARAAKKTFVYQLEKRMIATKTNKNKVRKALGSPTTTTRIFDEEYTSSSLDTMTRAANAVGCELQIALVPRKFAK